MRLLREFLNKFSKWEYIGSDDLECDGKTWLKSPNLSLPIHIDILITLRKKARSCLGSRPVYAKGKTYLYKGVPAGDWYENHGHGGGYLHIYRRLHAKKKKE